MYCFKSLHKMICIRLMQNIITRLKLFTFKISYKLYHYEKSICGIILLVKMSNIRGEIFR